LDVKDIQFQNSKVLQTQSQHFATFLTQVLEFKTRKKVKLITRSIQKEDWLRLFPVVLTSGKCHI